jgi:hypothetical protein
VVMAQRANNIVSARSGFRVRTDVKNVSEMRSESQMVRARYTRDNADVTGQCFTSAAAALERPWWDGKNLQQHPCHRKQYGYGQRPKIARLRSNVGLGHAP